jgi:glucan phosphoethanolaminetransferase (alkaline phosphatase superfamily)
LSWALHFHLIAAVSWIGGSIFLFVLGIALSNKEDQALVYPRIGPIYGYFELVMLASLLISGYSMILNNGLIEVLFTIQENEILEALQTKLVLVTIIVVLTIVHMVISLQTIHKEKSLFQKLMSRGSSLGILLLNLWVLHYAMVLRDGL